MKLIFIIPKEVFRDTRESMREYWLPFSVPALRKGYEITFEFSAGYMRGIQFFRQRLFRFLEMLIVFYIVPVAAPDKTVLYKQLIAQVVLIYFIWKADGAVRISSG